jgi:hypothetical protein
VLLLLMLVLLLSAARAAAFVHTKLIQNIHQTGEVQLHRWSCYKPTALLLLLLWLCCTGGGLLRS